MATASRDLTVVPVPQETLTGITLQLTLDEARALMLTCVGVAGEPCGPRGALDRIAGALEDAGVTRVYRCNGDYGYTGILRFDPLTSEQLAAHVQVRGA